MKTIRIPNGIMHLIESKAICPYCEHKISLQDFDDRWMKQPKHYMRIKCKCKRFIGITQDMRGDFVAYKLNN